MKPYLAATRSPWCSYLFVLPLLVLYQGLVLLANFGASRQVVNGADALLQALLQLVGVHGWLASWVALAAIIGVVLYRTDAAGRTAAKKEYFSLLLLESAVYAVFFGALTSVITSFLLPFAPHIRISGGLSWLQLLSGSLGAGLYEELVFRLLLIGGGTWALRLLGMKDGVAGLVTVLGSSVLFSLVHYVGPLGDAFSMTSFVYRFVAGVLLAGLYFTRGFAVAAWTHALYDVFLLLLGKG